VAPHLSAANAEIIVKKEMPRFGNWRGGEDKRAIAVPLSSNNTTATDDGAGEEPYV